MRGASLIILAMIVASALSQTEDTSLNQAGCGKRPRKPAKVVGGGECAEYDYGWQVELRSGGTSGGSLFCGGSLINSRWVVTAAHCTVSQRPGTFRIVAGHHNRASDANTIISSVTKVINKPDYNSANFRNDISLVKLAINIPFDGDKIIPVCVPAQGADYATTNPNEIVQVTGWGTVTGGGLAQRLQHADVPITPYTTCENFYGTSIDRPSMICAGAVGDGKDTCQGDSGGPVNFETSPGTWTTIGITSWGRGCGDIGVYSRISAYRDWIQQTMDANLG